MRKKLQLLTLLFAFVACTVVNAQTSQIGHVDSDRVLGSMPEMKRISDQVESLSKQFESQLQTKMQTLNTKGQQYSQEAEGKTEAENNARRAELEGMQKEIQELEGKARQEIQTKQKEMLNPVLEKAQAAVDKVAAAKGLLYVFDVAKGGIVYTKGTDITGDVLAELGVK